MSDTNKTNLTPERLDKLSNLASLATPGPWRPIQLERPTTRLALVEQIVANWLHPEGSPLCDPDFFGVVAGEGDQSVSTCMTANGPTSRVNACFIAAANPETVLALVDEVERLRSLLAACAKSPGYAACLRECKEDHQ